MVKRLIYQQDDIHVYQNGSYRWLTFNSSAIQTLINRHKPHRIELTYIRAMTLATDYLSGPSCILGLGGGGIAHALSRKNPHMPIIAVENNATVIDVASSFFMTNTLSNLSIFHQDAFTFIKNHQTRYQHMFIDLFHADEFPKHCATPDFIEHCQRLLLPQGILAINIVNAQHCIDFFNQLRRYFSNQTIIIPVHGATNVVILAYHDTSITPLLTWIKHHQPLKKLTWTPQWGCTAML